MAKRTDTNPAFLAVIGGRSEMLRSADWNQMAAAAKLHECARALSGTTLSPLDAGQFFGEVFTKLMAARLNLMIAAKIHNRKAHDFIDGIMRTGKKRKPR